MKMNTKKSKNKKPNKSPNLNPPQVVENVKVPEKVDDISKVESELKIEERVPEIISDVIPPPIGIKAVEVEIPKKPKRNRGKKKKQDKDETEDQDTVETISEAIKNIQDPIVIKESSVPETLAVDTLKVPLIDTDVDVLETAQSLLPDITPSTRKKKNKNKKNSNQEQIVLIKEKKSDIIEGTLLIETENVAAEYTEISPQKAEDVKPSKKKNKKKKRNDSEKSDKVEEISCTAVFENPLVIEHENVGDVEKEKEKKETVESFITIGDDIHKCETSEEKSCDFKLEEKTIKIEDDVPKFSKNKKKNKKGKSDAPKTDLEHEQVISDFKCEKVSGEKTWEKTNIEETSKDPQNKTEKNDSKDVPENIIIGTTTAIEEDIVKPKAKIAKPVDKKRKEKPQNTTKESDILETNVSEASRPEKTEIETDKGMDVLEIIESTPKVETKIREEPLPEEIKDVIILGEPISIPLGMEKREEIKSGETPLQKKSNDDVILTTLVELINAPPTMGKKRKKSPKPSKNKPKEVLSEENQPSASVGVLKKSPELVEESKYDLNIEEKTVAQGEDIKTECVKIDPVNKELLEQLSESKSEASPLEVEIETRDVSQAKKDPLVSKPGKKSKKSPKPQTKLEIIETEPEAKFEKFKTKETGKELEQKVNETEDKIDIEITQSKEVKTDEFCDLPDMEDIEIRSVKTDETEELTPEATPDNIQYPRPISQQQADDNNNTIIQEIAVSDDVKLGIPLVIPDTPFFRADIPLMSPELVASGIKVIDVSNITKSSEVEKTDLKSKMMEVNQDMEELRLSIERSLAELTSMEKSEEKIEKQFEEQIHSKVEETKATGANETNISSVLDTSRLESQDKQSQDIPNAVTMKNKNILEDQQMPVPGIAIPMPSLPPLFTDIKQQEAVVKSSSEDMKPEALSLGMIPPPPPMPKTDVKKGEQITVRTDESKPIESTVSAEVPPVCPARKDNKGKGKSKKKGKQEAGHAASQTAPQIETPSTVTKESSQEVKKEQKTETAKEKTKQQSYTIDVDDNETASENKEKGEQLADYEPIENFEDAMTSSVDDVNKTFEMIANEAQSTASHLNPEINITAPIEDQKIGKKDEKTNPVTQPKNLLGHPDIPVRSNKMDYKKEKNKPPNTILAKVKIKDSVQIETSKQSKESQTDNIKKLMKKQSIDESFSKLNESEEYVYKYSFRKVFLPNVCHVCKKELKQSRVACSYCNLLFYCSTKHKDEDWPQHQALCFAVSTIVHLKEQKHIYEDAKNITGHNYRLLRMQMIVSCEKVLKRKLAPWEQEALLYPRICADVGCREWRQNKLTDCEGCGQMSFCTSHPDHFPKSHQRWCKSYSLYQKLVCYQQTKGRLEPKLPSRVMLDQYQLPEKINEVLASMYTEKIDMNDVEYATLTQLATAPLTAVYSCQIYTNKINSIYANGTFKKTSFTVHVVGAELQYEADALSKWEVFFLHLRPDVKELRVSLIAPDLNPHNLPLELLGKVKLCESCRLDKRRVLFSFQDKKTYTEYYKSDEFVTPDLVCAFNPSIQRSSVYNGKDTWPATINCILKQKIPFTITSHTMEELGRDLGRIKECSDLDYNMISQPKHNSFASVRPDRNFISDDEMPLLFKNYCFAVISGVF